MNALVRKLDKFDATVAWINGEKQLFNKEITPFQELTDIKVHDYVKTVKRTSHPQVLSPSSKTCTTYQKLFCVGKLLSLCV